MPMRPISARPLSAPFGNVFSRSHAAACGAICSTAKRRTAWRISSCVAFVPTLFGANVGYGVMTEELAILRVTLGRAVDAAPADLEDPRGAIDVLALRWREEGGIQLRG